MTSTRRLDPDRLAALEEEREFLLASLDDLEAERSAGDIDDVDYEALKDDYTRRAAEVIRSVESEQAAFRSVPRVGWKQAAAWLVGLALLGGLSGVLIARSSGARGANDTLSGGVRESTVSLLNEARSLFSNPDDWSRAVEIYDRVLEEEPTNVEALTYRGWLGYRIGGPADVAIGDFEEVARLDAGFPDAIVFHTIVLADEKQYGDAADVLATLDLDNAPAQIGAIVGQRGLVGEVFGEAAYDRLLEADDVGLDALGLDAEQALAAAAYLLETDKDGRSIAALRLYRAVRESDPGNPGALSREAWLLFQTLDPELEERAVELVNRAVEANPSDPEALFTRASILATSDQATACGDLDVLVALDSIDEEFRSRAAGLRDQLCA